MCGNVHPVVWPDDLVAAIESCARTDYQLALLRGERRWAGEWEHAWGESHRVIRSRARRELLAAIRDVEPSARLVYEWRHGRVVLAIGRDVLRAYPGGQVVRPRDGRPAGDPRRGDV